MGKKCLTIIIILVSLLSCSSNVSSPRDTPLDYKDIEHLKIEYQNIFNLEKEMYFAYFFSEHCHYCNQIKEKVITYALTMSDCFYFIEYTTDITLLEDVHNTIGCSSTDCFGIKGTPTLVLISDYKVEMNLCGAKTISAFLNLF